MRWSLAGLAPLLSVVLRTTASPLGTNSLGGFEHANFTHNLFRRVRTGAGDGGGSTPLTTTDLFLLDNEPGNCQNDKPTIDGWLGEIALLHSAVERASAEYVGDQSYMLLWYVWFGIQFDGTGRVDRSKSGDLWDTIQDHISRVSQFLSGGGLRNPQVAGEKPRLFCSADAGVVQPWDSAIVRDHEGKDVIAYEDESTGYVEYLKLGTAFMSEARKSEARAFWMPAFKGYDLDYRGADTLCPGASGDGAVRSAKTARPTSAWPPIFTDDAEFTFGKANRHILLCPAAFSPIGTHGYASLADIIDPDEYPVAGSKDAIFALDKLLPISATLYHELYHLTDDDNTPDQAYRLNQIAGNARNPATRQGNAHNPETYAVFAMATYLFLHAPASMEPALYIGSFPKPASNPFAP